MNVTTRLLLIFLVVSFLTPSSFAQSSSPARNAPAQVASPSRTTADETFELNIDQRRIVEEDFSASTMVDLIPNEQGVGLQIGVALSAVSINVLLINVRGRVRFRGRLDRIVDVLNSRRRSTSP